MTEAVTRRTSFDILDEPHSEALEKAVLRILSTEIAEVTYAQIIDGLPLSEVACDVSQDMPHVNHPIRHDHTQFCSGSLETARGFRDQFSLDTLKFDSKILLAYLACSSGSRAFNTRLIELLAMTVHEIAVQLFQLKMRRHQNDNVTQWTPPKSDEHYWKWHPNGPPPTMFIHSWYLDHEQYPQGVADMAGYWAESRVFGGVVLFDRHDPDKSDAVYLHPNRRGLTYRICRLLPQQKQALIRFISEPPESCPNPLPILVGKENRDRVDPEEPIEETGVYRDIWERKYRPFNGWDARLRDVWDQCNYPTLQDMYQSSLRAAEREDQWKREQRMKQFDGEEETPSLK